MSQSSNNHIDEGNPNRNNDDKNDNDCDDDHNSTNTTLVYPIPILDRMNKFELDGQQIWLDRIALQNTFTLYEKGWQVSVEWKVSSHVNDIGIGVFAKQSISSGTILRIGILNHNLLQFNSIHDIETFCNERGPSQYHARLQYVQDYLWGYYPSTSITDENGYPHSTSCTCSSNNNNSNSNSNNDADERFFGVWIPGNGLNHNTIPNTVYRNDDDFTTKNGNRALYLIALRDIQQGDELYDDYRRHGMTPPLWLKNYAIEKNITLNFADCNDFVV